MQVLFSVVTPVFNAELFLAECIQSVLNQTWTDFELILVNDGSTDTSASICMEYANIDNRITVITQENKGQTAARMAGIHSAKGDYCLFLDADDRWDHKTLAQIAHTIAETHCDMVLFDYVRFDQNLKYPVRSLFNVPRKFLREDLRILWREYALSYTLNSMCTKAVRLDCIPMAEIAAHPRLCTSEDMLMGMSILQKVKTVVYINLPLYEYRQHLLSAVHQIDMKRLNDIVSARVLALEMIKTSGVGDDTLIGEFCTQCILALIAELAKMFRSNVKLSEKQQAFTLVIHHPNMEYFLKKARMKNQKLRNRLRLVCIKLGFFWMVYGLEKVLSVYKEIRYGQTKNCHHYVSQS